MASKILIALAVLAVVLVMSEGAFVPQPFQSAAQKDGNNCVCMNWRNCDGRINSDIHCQQSYIFVCCIIDSRNNVADEKAKIIPMEFDNQV